MGDHVVLAERVRRPRLEEEEPRADGTVGILEPDRDEADFLAGHLGAGLDREVGAGAGVEGRIPGPARALADGPGTEHVHGAAHGREHGLGLEYVELVLPGAESDGAGDLVAVHQGLDDEHPLVDVFHAQGILGRFRDDDLVGLAVDHELPPAFMHVLAVGALPDGESPFLEEMDGRIDVAGDVVDEVLTGDPHEVLPHIVHILFRCIVTLGNTHILVQGR